MIKCLKSPGCSLSAWFLRELLFKTVYRYCIWNEFDNAGVVRCNEYFIGPQINAILETSCLENLLKSLHKLNRKKFLSQIIICFDYHRFEIIWFVSLKFTIFLNICLLLTPRNFEWIIHTFHYAQSIWLYLLLLSWWNIATFCHTGRFSIVCIFLNYLINFFKCLTFFWFSGNLRRKNQI